MEYKLNFLSDNYGKKTINEPFGMYDVTFNLNQKQDGGKMGRDVSFSSGEALFEFTDQRDHQLKQLLYYHRKFGFEAKVVLSISINDSIYNCDLDFATAETDGLTYFKAKGIEDSSLQIIKARKKTKVDLFSGEDIDGNFIEPLVADNMLLLAKPVVQISKWEQVTDYVAPNINVLFINPCQNLINAEIQDSYTFFNRTSIFEDSFKLIKAINNLESVSIFLKNVNVSITSVSASVSSSVHLLYGQTIDTATDVILFSTPIQSVDLYYNKDLSFNIEKLNRDDSIWIYIKNTGLTGLVSISGMSMQITAESIAYNSVAQSVRLVDVMKQVTKSISGLEINAPRFEALGEFYDNRLLSGNLLRGINNKGFKVSLEDLENSFDEFKGDFEIGSDGKIFFGIEKDFYTNIESGFFNDIQFKEMSKTFNPEFTVNEFKYAYKNYQSLKENQELNSADTIHGESIQTFFNKNVENSKDAKIEWTRDAFLIEVTRALALVFNENTAAQDDDTIFAIDSINTTFNSKFTEVTELQHTYDAGNNRLSIRNNGSVNFISLGITVGSIFIIQPTDLNSGTYSVFSVENNSLELTRLLNNNTSAGNGIRSTKYTYELTQDFVPFTNYTSQGFTETTNLNAANSYSNRRYSIARNVFNYWKSYLATCNLYWKDKPLKNTFYKNNGDYTAKYAGVKLTEKADFLPDNPILSPIMYNDIVFANVDFEDFIILQSKVRSERGYIRAIDNNLQVIKFYPVDIEYSLAKKELKIKGKEKYEPVNMTISTENEFILVNNETRLDTLRWEIKDEMLYLYDTNRYRLYNGVYWFEVSVNGAIANDIEQLIVWLKLIK